MRHKDELVDERYMGALDRVDFKRLVLAFGTDLNISTEKENGWFYIDIVGNVFDVHPFQVNHVGADRVTVSENHHHDGEGCMITLHYEIDEEE